MMYNRLVDSNAQNLRALLQPQASSSSGPLMGRPLRLDWQPGDTRIRQATYGVRYQSRDAYGVLSARGNGCGYEAIKTSSSLPRKGKRVLSKEIIGKILRLSGYPNFIDGANLTPELIIAAYQYSVKHVKGTDMPIALNHSCYILDICTGVVAKYRHCEMHPGTEATNFNQNIRPGIFIILGLASYSDAVLRMGIANGTSVDWASVVSDNVKACMTDQQRGIGMNPPRGMVDVFRDPEGHVQLEEGDTELRATRIDAVRMDTTCLRWIFADLDRVPAIYGATDCFVTYDGELHGHIPCGHYVVDIPRNSCLRHMCAQYVNNDRGVVLDHNTVRTWLDAGDIEEHDIRMVVLPLHSRQRQWGPRLALAVNKYLTYVEEIERDGDVGKSCAKNMVNYLVGSWAKITHCTSTVKSVTASDPSYLNAMLFTAGQVGSANVSIARYSVLR